MRCPVAGWGLGAGTLSRKEPGKDPRASEPSVPMGHADLPVPVAQTGAISPHRAKIAKRALVREIFRLGSCARLGFDPFVNHRQFLRFEPCLESDDLRRFYGELSRVLRKVVFEKIDHII